MNDQTMMLRLMWKDLQTIKPLLFAATATMLAGNLLAFLFWHQGEMRADTYVGFTYALWFLLPGFTALGVPAMIVGTEEETGTGNWLRTLPVPWQTIARAKLWVAAGAVLFTWLIASGVLALASLGWPEKPQTSVSSVFRVEGFLIFAFFGILLLLLGFACSYLIRSPLLSLLALLPTYFFSVFGVNSLIHYLGIMTWGRAWPQLISLGVGVLLVAWVLQLWLARRRFLLPIHSFVPRAITTLSETHEYRPSRLPVRTQPSQVVSLLWQQLRQTGLLSIALVGISAFLAFTYALTYAAANQYYATGILGLAPGFIVLSASWLGAIVFYGDNVHRRCAFFADRGISPTRVWWTRIAPPAAACLVLLALIGIVALVTYSNHRERLYAESFQSMALMIVMFSFGQLVSQWADRPLLAFLAAPAYAFVSLTPVFYLMQRFHANFAVILLTAPVLLFATWQMTRHWLDGEIQTSYTARVLGYTALAVLMPCLWIAITGDITSTFRYSSTLLMGATP
jgi:hypothetical protein